MAYRDEGKCHVCGAETRASCPVCANAICEAHTLAAHTSTLKGLDLQRAERLARRLGGGGVCVSCLDREMVTLRGPFVVIHRCTDPVENQMLVEVLEEEGFAVRGIGSQVGMAALLGAGQHIFEQRIEVPEGQAEEAAAHIAALLTDVEAGATEVEDEEDGEDGEDEEDEEDEVVGTMEEEDEEDEEVGTMDGEDEELDDQLPARRRGVAMGLPFIFPGAAHIYAYQPLTGVILLASFAFGLFFFLFQASFASLGGVVASVALLDLVGGQLALSAARAGERSPWWSQIVKGLAMALVAYLVAISLK